ncbi:MAG: hypothetical protein KAJ23_09765 [Maribacter sp.]|nr:hypothetical protein [Maribacter sp.]
MESQANDSIFVWIKKGRNIDISNEVRLKFLQKAHKHASECPNDSLKPKYFSKLSLAYLKLGDSLLFRTSNKETQELALKVGDSVSFAEMHWDLGTFFRNRSIADSAYHHYVEAQKIYGALQDKFSSGRMWYNIALVQANVKDYTGSEVNIIKALELVKPLNKNMQLFNCYNLMGRVTKDLKEYERALKYYNLAWDYLTKLEDKEDFEEQLLNNIGVVYQEQGQHQKAISFFKLVLATKGLKNRDAELFAISLNNLAHNQLKLGNSMGLEKQLYEALSVHDSIGDVRGVSESHYVLAEFYLNQKDSANALNEALQARTYAKQSTHNKNLLKTLRLLVRLEPKNAMAYTNEYMALSDSLLQEERQARNKFTRIRFETDEFIAKKEVLTRKKQIWTGVAIGLFLLGTALYIIAGQRVKNQKLKFQQRQQASNQEIFNLMLLQKQNLEEGKQIEQKRISRELHDGILDKMLGTRMVLTGLNKKTDEKAARERAIAISVLKDLEVEVRSISHELSHAAYQKLNNFISSIQQLLKNSCLPSTIKYNLIYNEELDWDALGADIKINLYRMVEECLRNSVKHGVSKNILVNFICENNLLTILIEDDGKGFVRTEAKKGIGTRNIESRIAKLGGTWKINSIPGKGTKVILKIPIEIVHLVNDIPLREEKTLIES